MNTSMASPASFAFVVVRNAEKYGCIGPTLEMISVLVFISFHHIQINTHHFPLSFLHSEKNGPLPCIEKHTIVEERVNLEKDVILFGSEKGKLYAAPCHPWHDVCDNVDHRQTPK
uniref:Uncharacterized protein n=1 Tax=Ditylum brightwellii TaxID=49249 RepID=A0A7S4T7K7_9STRA|mmetsp:Transcript_45762/g.69028  ORF Transcript_45762/g.69028 Transcript_45762/m.69028 type:complete len:115 (-) Transcript_45762:285-629(-)